MNVIDIVLKCVNVLGILALVGITWKASGLFAEVKVTMALLMENHLPHIYEELKYLRDRIDDIVNKG